MKSSDSDWFIVYGNSDFSAIWMNEPCMTAGLSLDIKPLFYKKFDETFGCDLREFGHQAETLAPVGIIARDLVINAVSCSNGIISPSFARQSR